MRDFAIVIPTKDRPKFLARTLNYYVRHHTHVFVGDSSRSRFLAAGGCTILPCPEMNELEATLQAVQAISEPYVFFQGDDDFADVPTLERFAKYLDENPDVDSVTGRCLLFSTRDDQITGKGILEGIREHPDEMFRLYRRDVLKEALLASHSKSSAHLRGLAIMRYLDEFAASTVADAVHLFRHGHAGRVTAKAKPRHRTFREWLGYHFPTISYIALCLRTPCWVMGFMSGTACRRCSVTLPILRRGWHGQSSAAFRRFLDGLEGK